jgi:hypothetical protein
MISDVVLLNVPAPMLSFSDCGLLVAPVSARGKIPATQFDPLQSQEVGLRHPGDFAAFVGEV